MWETEETSHSLQTFILLLWHSCWIRMLGELTTACLAPKQTQCAQSQHWLFSRGLWCTSAQLCTAIHRGRECRGLVLGWCWLCAMPMKAHGRDRVTRDTLSSPPPKKRKIKAINLKPHKLHSGSGAGTHSAQALGRHEVVRRSNCLWPALDFSTWDKGRCILLPVPEQLVHLI